MREHLTVKIKKLHNDAKLPVFSTEGAAGADLHAYIPRDGHSLQFTDSKGPFVRIYPDEHKVIGCGIAIQVPEGYEAQVRPRSGLAAKLGISIVNAPGTVDSDYRGEVGAILINHGTAPFDVYTDTVRGAGGMGSTGVSS